MGFDSRRTGILAGALVTVLLAAAAFATVASAQTFVVNSLGDQAEQESCGFGPTCTLREAIERSNGSAGADTIEFAVAGTIAVESSSLPRIEGPLTIDGASAPGFSGAPVVDLNGSNVVLSEGPTDGLDVGAGPTTITGLAVGNFPSNGIDIESAEPVQVCDSYIGTDLSGSAAAPNFVGVSVEERSLAARIGAGCPAGEGNLISGNEFFGVADRGQETEIAANRIGLSAANDPLGNGGREEGGVPEGGGIEATAQARGTFIGPAAAGAGNTIAFNEVTGVRVAASARRVTIGGNSIHSNTGPGIEYEGEPKPSLPLLDTAEGRQSETSAAGTLEGEPGESYFVELFANEACDPSGAGEGQTPIGGLAVTADASGKVTFSAHGLDPLPPGQAVITATATPELGSTSEFSKCLTATIVPPEEAKPPPPGGPLPVNGESVAVAPSEGTILVKLPGQKNFHPLRSGEIIPVGTIIDATNGRVTLTSIDDEGHEQTAVFYGGKFQVFQQPGSTLVILRLRGDGPGTGACQGAAGGGASGRASATISRRQGRHLWGSGHGSFRTEGTHGSATVRGTIWFTEDRCDGTFFKTKRGVVTIRDFAKHKTLLLPAGQEYLAQAP